MPDRKRMKKLAAVVAVTAWLSVAVLMWVSHQVDYEVKIFVTKGVVESVRIVEFREVSSGRQPNRRRIAIARMESRLPSGTEHDNLVSHILMSDNEVDELRIGQVLPVVVLPGTDVPANYCPGKYWFVTQRSLDRHGRNPVIEWGWKSMIAISVVGVIAGTYAIRR